MIIKKPSQDIAILREGGKRLAQILGELSRMVRPGVSTESLNRRAERLIFRTGGIPSFLGYKGKKDAQPYPASICVSVNSELVHTPPREETILHEGDVVGIDIGMWWPRKEGGRWKMEGGQKNELDFSNRQPPITNHQPLCTDTAITVGVGKISKDADRLLRRTKEALDVGIAAARVGATVGDIGHVVETCLKKYNLGIVRQLAGHGVGYQVHEEPLIPNYGKPGSGVRLEKGMVLAIEPMATLGGDGIITLDDGWTIVSEDGSLTAHFEHTIALTERGAEILTL